MPLWEYKHITSGSHGFATPALLENFLNNLGKEEWEIIHYQPHPETPLAFNAIARRPTTRDWTLDDAVSAAAAKEAEKLRAEFEAKFKGNTGPAQKEEEAASLISETEMDDSLRKLRNTDLDHDPEALADDSTTDLDEWDDFDDDLPTFFDAIKPFLRPNNKSPGQSVGIDYLAKRWEISTSDLKEALRECGFTMPESAETPPEYLEFDEDLYWININSKGQLFINTREKPRPAFKVAKAQKLSPDDPANIALAEEAAEAASREEARQKAKEETTAKQQAASADSLPKDAASLLDTLRKKMRRNRRSPGSSGSVSFLARIFKMKEKDLLSALNGIGLATPEKHGDKPAFLEIGGHLHWLNKDNKGNLWINTRPAKKQDASEKGPEQKDSAQPETAAADTQEAPSTESIPDTTSPLPDEQPSKESEEGKSKSRAKIKEDKATEADAQSTPSLSAIRLLLTPNKKGSGHSGELGYLARQLGTTQEILLSQLGAMGIPAPSEDPEAKPAFHEHEGEIYWIAPYAKDKSLWLNAKKTRKKTVKKDSADDAVKPKAKPGVKKARTPARKSQS